MSGSAGNFAYGYVTVAGEGVELPEVSSGPNRNVDLGTPVDMGRTLGSDMNIINHLDNAAESFFNSLRSLGGSD
jgi:hypothetical protein